MNDKLKHFLAGAGCALFFLCMSADWLVALGSAVIFAAVIGAIKEGVDDLGFGVPDAYDFAATVAGGAVAAAGWEFVAWALSR